MRKMKKFSDGGEVPDFSRLTFKEAFAAARKSPTDKGEFTWNGKRYNTDLAEDKPAVKAKTVKTTGPDESAAETARLSRAAKPVSAEPAKTSSSSSKSDSSELGTLAGAGAAALLGAAAAASRRNASPDISARKEPHSSPMKDINPRTVRQIGSNAPRLGGVRGGGGGGGGGGNSRELMLGSDLEVRGVRDAMNKEILGDYNSRSGDSGNTSYKRGGKVSKHAKGGSVKSSASKRADGCAVRGKTKGKIY